MNILEFTALSVIAVAIHNINSADAEGGWCYKGSCGPDTSAWPPLCHNGKRQTPIDLPQSPFPTGMASLHLTRYRGDHFRIQNNGHTVAVDFVGDSGENEGPTSQPFLFPDPLLVNRWNPADQHIQKYKFASAHFHWGVNDSVGSEHCIGKRCSAMELHFVHYLANYSSIGEAIASNLENALAVVGVLIDANPVGGSPGSALAPIVQHLQNVSDGQSHQPPVRVDKSLDFTQFLFSEEMEMFSYKGSLTTPQCVEQVNWYVFRRPALATREELKAFRTMLTDSHGEVMDMNYRPLQDRNGRDVFLSDLYPSQQS